MIKKDFLKKLNEYADSETNLHPKERLIPLKKLMLRFLRVHTKTQTKFNKRLIDSFEKLINSLNDELQGMYTVINRLKSSKKNGSNTSQSQYQSLYFPAHAEDFYLFQQEKFRGPFDLIKDRQKQYVPFFAPIKKASKTSPFIEVGFGRGEFLELLRENGVKKIIAVDINSKRVNEAKEKGFEAYHQNAVPFLMEREGTISGMSAFHVLEHMVFDEIFDLLYATYQKLVPGGLVIVETPNPENLQVGSWSFYIDHTHQRKLPPAFLKSIFEYIGFQKVEVIYSSPMKKNLKSGIEKMIYGDFDYAIVAYK